MNPLGAAWVRPRTATCRCAGHASGLSFFGALGRGTEDTSLTPFLPKLRSRSPLAANCC